MLRHTSHRLYQWLIFCTCGRTEHPAGKEVEEQGCLLMAFGKQAEQKEGTSSPETSQGHALNDLLPELCPTS